MSRSKSFTISRNGHRTKIWRVPRKDRLGDAYITFEEAKADVIAMAIRELKAYADLLDRTTRLREEDIKEEPYRGH